MVLYILTLFCDVAPYSVVDVYRHFGGKYYLHFRAKEQSNQGASLACLMYYSTLKMEAICSCKTSVNV
jgi:hypothetical protein